MVKWVWAFRLSNNKWWRRAYGSRSAAVWRWSAFIAWTTTRESGKAILQVSIAVFSGALKIFYGQKRLSPPRKKWPVLLWKSGWLDPWQRVALFSLVTRRVVKWCLTWRVTIQRARRIVPPSGGGIVRGGILACELWAFHNYTAGWMTGWYTAEPAACPVLLISIDLLRYDILPANTPSAHYNAIILPWKNRTKFISISIIYCADSTGAAAKMSRYPRYNRVLFFLGYVNVE